MRVIFVFTISVLLFAAIGFSQSVNNEKNDNANDLKNYIPGKIVLKLNKSFSDQNHDAALSQITAVFESKTEFTIARKFPKHKTPDEKSHISGKKPVDLSLIYELIVPEHEDIDELIHILNSLEILEYAEKYYIPELLEYIPDDPLVSNQYYLENIQAYEAWSIARSDTNQVIAIIDTGTDLIHSDLINSIKYNYDDLENGEDSDHDGYIDNFHGWDLGENNNNPQYNANYHGVLVSGLAAATADNGTGIIGTGFNSKFLPVKIDNENGTLTMAYEGIIYAADRGATVINLSWGGSLGAGQFGQDIINYAVINRDVVVVAAAGNSNNQTRIYPAAYENALSISATDINDVKWSGSSYGITIDMSAPGSNVLTTWPNSSYNPGWGTSFAAPIVSGAAAILRSHFPDYNALQIAAQLKVTTDNIDTISGNENYAGMMGTGRLNLHKALTETDHPYIKLSNLEHEADYYSSLQPGETFELSGYFQNILASADNITAVLETNSPYIDIITNEIELGNAPYLEIIDNLEQPFVISISEDYPPSQAADFIIRFYVDGNNYAGRETFSLILNINYLDIYPNKISTTITSTGTLGYNYPNYSQGIGFQYNQSGRSLVKCAGLLIGNSTSKVVDNVYGASEGSFDQMFVPVINANPVQEPEDAETEITGKFNDNDAGAFILGLDVEYVIKAWENEPDNKYIILEYDIINKGDETLSSLYAGFYADWILQDHMNHLAAYEEENKLGYAYSADGGYYTGISLLSDNPIKHYAFDNKGFGGSLKISDGFTSFEKYTALKSNRHNAGLYDVDNDISTLVSSGPFVIAPGDTATVAFAIIAGDYLNDIITSSQLARIKYQGEEDDDDDDDDDDDTNSADNLDAVDHDYIYISGENPFSNELHFSVELFNYKGLIIRITDLSGNIIEQVDLNNRTPGTYNIKFNSSEWSSGVYILQLFSGNTVKSYKVVKVD